MKRTIVSFVVFASTFVAGTPNAQARDYCTTTNLRGGYGFFVSATILPAGIPRSILGRIEFDGVGNFTNTLTFNENGRVTHATDVGTYAVDFDCTGKLFTNGGTRTVEIVLVDGGKEFYQLRTDDASILFGFNVAKKQLPDNGDGGQASTMQRNNR